MIWGNEGLKLNFILKLRQLPARRRDLKNINLKNCYIYKVVAEDEWLQPYYMADGFRGN